MLLSSWSYMGFPREYFFPGASGPLAPKFCFCVGPQLFVSIDLMTLVY